MKRFFLFAIIVFLLFFLSCLSNNKNITTFKPEIGKLVAKQQCTKDISVTYSYYLPKSYSEGKKYPIIIFFDSHADGVLPVSKYQEIAENYNYIIVGSNNSKNGMQWYETSFIAKTIIDDCKNKFSIDTNRINTSGFSGGSRVASNVAAMIGGIYSVIGCGAGFGNFENSNISKFKFIGLVGNQDFNLAEMEKLNSILDKSDFIHEIIVFNGKHEWPPVETMKKAFLWIELNTMKDKIIDVDEKLINNFAEDQENIAKNLNSKDINLKFDIYNNLYSFLKGLKDVSKYEQELNKIKSDKNYLQYIKNQELIIEKEQNVQNQLIQDFQEKPINWWKDKIKQLNNNSDSKSLESLMNKRLIGYLGLMAYMYSNQAVNTGNFEYASKFLQIYELVEPQNSEHAYLSAILEIKQNNVEKTLKFLKKSVNLGFNDLNRIQNDINFQQIKNNNDFIDILNSIKVKK